MHRFYRFLGFLLLFGLLPLAVVGQTMPPPASSASASTAGGFGQSMTIVGGDLFVGEARSIHAPGRVLIYRWTGDAWAEHGELTADDAEVGDGFGRALASDGDRLLIGASDRAYVFAPDADGWSQTARLDPPTEAMADAKTRAFGTRVALDGATAVVNVTDPPFTFDPGPTRVVVFEENSDGWTATHTLDPGRPTNGTGFGDALALSETELFVSAPRDNDGAGQVHIFARSNDDWSLKQTLNGIEGHFGTSLLLRGDELMIGAPGAVDRRGAVQVARSSNRGWQIDRTLLPFDAPTDAAFGRALAQTRTDAETITWVGAPGAADETGAVYRIDSDGAERLVHPNTRVGDRLGHVLAADGMHLLSAQPGKDYGARMSGSSSVVARRTDSNTWVGAPMTAPDRAIFSAVTGSKTTCTDGKASLFDCSNVDLLSFLPVDAIGGSAGVRVNDVWGWTDPSTGRDYAVVGRVDGTSFVDVTDPMQPVYVGDLPATDGTVPKIWRDVKVYKNHAFIVADNVGKHGMQIFDLTQLRDVSAGDEPPTFEATALYDGVHSAHNVFINEDTGFAYIVGSNGGGQTCGGGLHMVDVNTPTEPTFAGCYADVGTGMTGTGTTHDTQCVVYSGPDERYQGQEICFASNETAVSITDVTDKQQPKAIARAEHPRSAYIHQGWLTEDQRYLYVNDELDEMSGITDRTRTFVWDVARLDDPQLVTEFFLSVPAADHNLYVDGDTMYQANYASGLRVIDISDPEAPREVGHFDTLPFGADAPIFEGAFSNYPFFDSGIVVVTSIQEGLFVVKRAQTEL